MTGVLDGERLIERLPEVRGKLTPMRDMAGLTWFQVGGPAEVLFQPADEDDLADFLKACPEDVPVTPVGIGSNLLVRDGGVFGVVIRLGRGFNAIETDGARVTAGAAVPDALVARKAAAAGIGGLEFLRGVPGTIGGALTMNAGCYGRELKDVLVEARAIDRHGERLTFTVEEMGFSYRHAEAAERDLVWTGAVLEGQEEDAATVTARMEKLVEQREASQPIRDRGLDFPQPGRALLDRRRGRHPRAEGVDADRRGRLPRADRRRRAGEREALQLPREPRRGQRRGPRRAGRDGARARAGAFRPRFALGNQAHRR